MHIKKQPISEIAKPRLVFAGDHGSYIWRNLSNQRIKLGKLQFDDLPQQVKVLSDTCSNRRLGGNKTCALEMTLVDAIGTLKPYRLKLPYDALLPRVSKTPSLRTAAATPSSTDTYLTGGTAGGPGGIYASSCQNISFGSSALSTLLTADCLFWNGSAFSINVQTTLDYSSCTDGGNLTGEVASDPLTGQLECATANVLATQAMPPNATPGGYSNGGCDNPSWDPATQYLTCSNLNQSLYYPGCKGLPVGTGGTAESWSLICTNDPYAAMMYNSSWTNISELTKMWGFSYLAKDGSTWNPWATLSCDASSGNCSNSTPLSSLQQSTLIDGEFWLPNAVFGRGRILSSGRPTTYQLMVQWSGWPDWHWTTKQ